jgi:hypothetical protein
MIFSAAFSITFLLRHVIGAQETARPTQTLAQQSGRAARLHRNSQGMGLARKHALK